MDDRIIPLPQVAQELHVSGDAARRAVLKGGPEVSELRDGRRFVSYSWLQRTIAEREQGADR